MDLLLQEAGVTVQTQDAAKEIKSDAKNLNDDLPPNWKKATSSNGKVYYFNKLTRETRWERPVENSMTIVISEKSSASLSGSNYVATNTSATSMSSIGPGESLPKSTSLDSCHSLPPPPEDGIASNSHSRRSSINHESNRQTSELSIANTRRKSVAPMIPTLVEAEKLPPPSVSPVAADPTPLLTTTDKTTETQSTPSEPVASVSEKVDDTQDLQSPPTLSVVNEKVEASNPETEFPTSNNTSNSPKKISSIINSLQSEVSKSEDQIREEKKAQRLSTNIAARISEFSTIVETSRPSTGGSPSATPRPLSGVFKMAQENVVNTANSPAQLNVPVSSARPRGPSVSMNKFNSPSATPDPQGSRSDNATPKNRSRGASVARTSSPLNPGGDFISELASKLQMPTPPQMSRSGSNATTIPESSDSSSIKRSGSGYSEDSANANGDPSVFTVEFSDDTILCFPSLDPSRVRLHGNLSLKSPDNSPKKNFVKWTPCYAILYNATFLLMKENPFKNKPKVSVSSTLLMHRLKSPLEMSPKSQMPLSFRLARIL
ncbi:hypothetical protein BKA69DRAFT_882454 [Paraphysoderma sedebokerense]|nr:hypothetical protein BKA69DRAFT_882454 [Paraphysoderma sedebokerense]